MRVSGVRQTSIESGIKRKYIVYTCWKDQQTKQR